MSNQFGKKIINTNKALFVTFPLSNSTASCDIYVPFPVYEIHVRGIDVDWQADYLTVVFFSSLFNDGPVGSAFCGVGSDFSTATKKYDISTINLEILMDPINLHIRLLINYLH